MHKTILLNPLKPICFLTISLWFARPGFTQQEANVWIAGDDYGIDFNYERFATFDRPTFNTDNELGFVGTSASICDPETGDLLFYTEGRNVWNANFEVMPNGEGMLGANGFGRSQSALIVPAPGNTDRYYLFTATSFEDSVIQNAGPEPVGPRRTGLFYSIVDMTLDGGRGDLPQPLKNRLLLKKSTDLLTAVPHDNGQDYWLITHEWGTNRFVVYAITEEGIGPPLFFEFGLLYQKEDLPGCLKASPNGEMLVFLSGNASRNGDAGEPSAINPVEWYDFDAGTGVISNRKMLGTYPNLASASFSPDNSKLYVSHYNTTGGGSGDQPFPPLLQFDLEQEKVDEIISTKSLIPWDPVVRENLPVPNYTLQLAPDGRLYNAATRFQVNEDNVRQRVLFFLETPDMTGLSSQPSYRFLDSPNNTIMTQGTVAFLSEQAFPNFMQHYFNELEPIDNRVTEDECAGITLTFFPNPTRGVVSVKSSLENCLFPARLKIYSVTGHFISEMEVDSGPFPGIDLSRHPAGMYFVSIRTFNRVEVKKVIRF